MSSRPVTLLVVFFIGVNVIAGAMMATGIDSLLGLDANIGGDDAVDESVNNAENVSTGTSLGDTLFGMYNVLASGVSDVFNVIFPGLHMLNRAGVPSWITGGILGPIFTVIMFIDFVSFLRGWGL